MAENSKTTISDMINKKDPIRDQIDDLILALIKTRKRNHITQNELAKKTGIPQTTISRVESFNQTPTLQVLIKLANELGMKLEFTDIM